MTYVGALLHYRLQYRCCLNKKLSISLILAKMFLLPVMSNPKIPRDSNNFFGLYNKKKAESIVTPEMWCGCRAYQ